MSKSLRFGAEIADKYLGQEDVIKMNTRDARYRYYQWLREWYGFGKREATNKCPFYQFMFWASLLMLVSIIPIVFMKLVEVFIFKPLSWVVPDWVEGIEEKMSQSKMMSSWFITILTFLIVMIVAGLFTSNVLAWAGLVLHWIFALPAIIVAILYVFLKWFIIEAIPTLAYWIWTALVFVGDILAQAFMYFIAIDWGILFLWLAGVFGGLIVVGIVVISFYKLTTWFFESKFYKWIIKESCKVREDRIDKKEKRREEIRDTQRKKLEEQWKWEEEHKDEIEAERKLEEEKAQKRQESFDEWVDFLKGISKNVWKGLVIFPGSIFIGIWYVFKYVFIVVAYVFKAIWWILKRIGDFFVIVWSLITETISNHCPPIDFIFDVNDTGILKYYKNGEYIFKCDNESYTIILDSSDKKTSEVAKENKIVFDSKKLKDGKKGTISCSIRTADYQTIQNETYSVYYAYYYDLKNAAPVYELYKLKLDPEKKKSTKPDDSRSEPNSMV